MWKVYKIKKALKLSNIVGEEFGNKNIEMHLDKLSNNTINTIYK